MSKARAAALLLLGPAIAASVTLLVHYSFGESWFYSRVPTLWIAALIWVLLCVRHVTRKSSGD